MNQTILDKPVILRYKKQIVALSIVALIFKALSCISFFVTYTGSWKEGYELSFQFPAILQLFSLVLGVLPYILLVLYIQKFHNEFRATIIIPIIFASIAALPAQKNFIENVLIYLNLLAILQKRKSKTFIA